MGHPLPGASHIQVHLGRSRPFVHLYLPLFDVNETNVFKCYHVHDYDVMMQWIVVDPVREGRPAMGRAAITNGHSHMPLRPFPWSHRKSFTPEALYIGNGIERWSSVRTLPAAPLWCDLGFVPNSRGNKARRTLALLFARRRATITK